MEITARPAVGAVWASLGPGVGAPSPVIATGDYDEYEVEMTLTVQPSTDGLTAQLVCSSLTTRQRPGGPPINSVGLHAVAVGRLVREAASQVVGPCEPSGSAAGSWSSADAATGRTQAAKAEDTVGICDDVSWTMESIDTALIRAQGPTDDNLLLAARIYQGALAGRGRPTVAVQTALGLPRSTAGYWITLARERGFLPPSAGRGKATG